jgi:hypothetical protein
MNDGDKESITPARENAYNGKRNGFVQGLQAFRQPD